VTILAPVIFDDIEAWTVAALSAALATRLEAYAQGVTVATKIPNPRTNRMVIVRRDGGGHLDAVREAPRLGINVFAASDVEAVNLARLVAALLWASPDGNPVVRVQITGGPYAVADTDSTQSRYYITAELISKGRNLA